MSSIKKLFLECLSKTSIKGVPRIIRHDAVTLKLIWLAGVLGLGGMATFTLVKLIVAYFSYTTTSTISEKSVFSQEDFSVMTLVVCNKQPISGTGLNKSGDIISFYQYMERIEAEIPKSEDTQELLDDLSSYSGYYQYIGKDNATRLGHQRDTFIADCRWLYASSSTTVKQRKCRMETIELTSNPRFYNCYKMPFLDKDLTYGIPVGLNLLLYRDRPKQQKYYVLDNDPFLSGGIIMSLGFSDTMGDFIFKSFDVRPGEATTARVRVKERLMASKPYSTCTGVHEVSYKDFDGKNVSYTEAACVNACLQDHIAWSCKCIDPELFVARSSELLNETFCEKFSGDKEQIMNSTKCRDTAIQKNLWSCESYAVCPPACEEFTYPVFLTTSAWPERSQLWSLYSTLIHQNRHKYSHDFDHFDTLDRLVQSGDQQGAEELLGRYMTENFAKVTLVMSSAYATVLKDVPTMTWDTILSQVGGALNLYSGISLIVCVEIIELLYKLLGSLFAETKAFPKERSTRVSHF